MCQILSGGITVETDEKQLQKRFAELAGRAGSRGS